MPSPRSPLPPPDLLPRTSLPRRPEADPQVILTRLDPALAGAEVRELGEGWDNVAYAVDDRLVLRVSKKEGPARRVDVARDVALLAFAGRHSSLRTNEVVGSLPDEGALLLTMVAGTTAERVRPADLGHFAATMAAFLTRLHTVPPVEVATVVQPDQSLDDWFAETVTSWRRLAAILEPSDRERVDAFLEAPLPPTPRRMVFCHNDLGDEHIVMADDGRTVSGIIDWSDAVLGDPARDLALLALDFGPAVLDRILEGYAAPTDPGVRRRALWFAAHAGVEGLCHRMAHHPDGPAAPLRRELIGAPPRPTTARDRSTMEGVHSMVERSQARDGGVRSALDRLRAVLGAWSS